MTRRKVVVKRLLALLRPTIPLMTVSAVTRVINQTLGVAIPGLAAALVVRVGTGSGVGRLIGLLVALALTKGIFRYAEQFTGHAVAFRLLSELRMTTFRNIVPLAPAGLDEERTGDLVTRVVGDIDRVEPFYAHTIAPLVAALAVPLLAAAGLAVWVDPVIAIVFLPFPLLIAVAAPWMRRADVARLSQEVREQAGETAAVLADTVQGAREIAIFRARETASARIDRLSDKTGVTRRSLARIAGLRGLVTDLLAGLAVVVMTVVAIGRLRIGAIDLAGVATAIVVAWTGTGPARALQDIVADLEQALAAAGRLFDLADREPPAAEPEQPTEPPRSGAVRLRQVTVQFPGLEPALREVNAAIGDGRHVAVVGPSGAGKSTLVELLVRFRDPTHGQVEIGDRDVRQIASDTLTETVMLVPQRPDIFHGTLEENLRLAQEDASDDQLWQALDRAALGDWARSLPAGLSTLVGELGETLSGGQRQRLALARAFLRAPLVLVLDEATSELDVETERRVLDEVVRDTEQRTVITVAHRLDTITDADEILVIDQGRLVEQGTHRELIDAAGTYAGLWQRHLDVVDES